MKITRNTLLIVLAVAAGSYALAQGNRVPGPNDYESFGKFITQRNIFDPNREPRYSGDRPQRQRTRKVSNGAPYFMLVGTMSYNKGQFAFFSGNSSELRQALQVNGKIDEYTVTSVTTKDVTIQGADKKPVKLEIGDRMQQENGKWEFLNGDELTDSGSAEPAGTESGSTSNSEGASPESSSPPPSPALEANDVLKRLMELRAKENQ